MRRKLNDSPVAQVVLVGLLVVVGAFLFLRMSGGGEEGEPESSLGPTLATVNGASASGDTPGEAVEGAVADLEAGVAGGAGAEVPSSVPAPPPPQEFSAAYESGKTVALLIVHEGGIDDELTSDAAEQIEALPSTALFRVPAKRIARYAAVTVGLDVNRVPALVVMRPKRLSGGVQQASVEYGFQTPQTVVQAVRDASYKGPEGTYHPD